MRTLIRTAAPLVVSVACFAVTLFTDRTLLMWFDPTSSAASMSAGNLYWTVACIPVTALGFVTPLIAMAAGGGSDRAGRDGRRRRIASLVWHVGWITAASLPLWFVLAFGADAFFRWTGHAADLAAAEATYFRCLLVVAPASMLEAGLSAFFVGRRITRPIMTLNLIAAAVNVVLDAWFIFGGLGLPAGGILGAAAATAAAMWIKVAIYVVLVGRSASFRRVMRQTLRPTWAIAGDVLRPGTVLGVSQLLRSFLMSFILLRIGRVSVDALAATTASLSLHQLVAIPMIGLSTAVTVLVGSGPATRAGRTITLGGWLVGGYMGTMALLMVLAPGPLLWLSLGDVESEAIRRTARSLLGLAAVYGLIDGALQVVAAGLKGVGRTLVLLLSMCAATGLVVAVVAVGGERWESRVEFWWCLLIGWAAVQLVMLLASTRSVGIRHRSGDSTPISEREISGEPGGELALPAG